MKFPPRLLVVGESVIDVVVAPDGSTAYHPGGSPANVALALGRLGHRPRLLTAIGRDPHGAVIGDWLTASDVELDPHSWTTHPTSTVVAHVEAKGAASYDSHVHWNPRPPTPAPVDFVHVGSISATQEPGDLIVEGVVQQALRDGALLSYDPNVRPALVIDEHRTRAVMLALVANSDLVKVSDEDLAWIAPGQDAHEAARTLLRRGPAMVVLTRGDRGASAYTRHGVISELPPPVAVVDTIGAGDTLMAALIAAMVERDLITDHHTVTNRPRTARDRLDALTALQVADTLRFAVAAAAVTVSRAGADPPWRREVVST